jgi:hypothetical protein
MQGAWRRTAAAAALVALGGCTAEAHDAGEAERTGTASSPAQAPPPELTAADTARARARVAAAAESLHAAFARAEPLTAREVAELRFDVNATQVASARKLGTRVSSDTERERLVREGRLVALPDSTEHWILREMEHAVPYATPEAQAMLEEIGRRFHARLDRLGLPRYRFKVTSALRTTADQEALRRVNRNAAWNVSAHEFGTTVDVSHERFAVPAGAWAAAGEPRVPELEAEALEEAEKEHGRILQAELGRAIWELRGEGVLHVMMEDAQPVYHMTVARPLPRGR